MNLWDAIKSGISMSNPLGAIATLGSSIISGISNNAAQKSANQANLDIANQNNQTSIAIADANRQAQIDMMRENNKFSREQAIEMFNLENAYNSPLEQVKRLKEAGINPAVFFGQGAGSAGTGDIATPSAAGSTISGSLPTLTTPHMEAAPPIVSGSIQAMAQLINMSLAAAQAEKTGADTAAVWKQIDKYTKEIENQDIQNAWNKFKFDLDKENLGKKQEAEIANLFSGVFKDYAEGGSAQMLMELHEVQKKLASEEYDILREKHPFLVQEAQELVKLRISQVETEKSIQEKNRAEASESRAREDLTREERKRLLDSHDAFVELQKNRAKLSKQDLERAERTTSYFVEQLKNAALISQKEYDLIQEQLESARRNNDWATFEKVFDKVERINNGVNQWMPWAFGRSTTVNESGWSEYQGTFSRSSSSTSRGR